MKLREVALAVVGLLLLYPGWRAGAPRGVTRVISAGGCQVSATLLEPARAREAGAEPSAVLAFHAISANRRTLTALGDFLRDAGHRVYLVDLPGHGDNTQPFSFARAEECAAAVAETLEQRGEIRLDHTVLVGHSLGGAIAMRLADRFPTAATVAISPAPMVPIEGAPPTRLPMSPPRRMPNNLLIFIGQLELPFAARAAHKLMDLAGGERNLEEDFRQKRAARLELIPLATHTSLLFDRRVAEETALWAVQALHLRGRGIRPWDGRRLAGEAAGLLGLLLVFPFVASLLAWAFALRRAPADSAPARLGLPPPKRSAQAGGPAARKSALIVWPLLGVLVVAALRFAVPLRWVVRMYAGDYLASFLMLVGLLALLVPKGSAPQTGSGSGMRTVAMAATLGALTMLAFGAWLDRELTDAWLNAARWWRFAALLPLLLPYFLAEEAALGPPAALALVGQTRPFGSTQGKRGGQGRANPPGPGSGARRLGVFLGLRLELWLAMLAGLFFLHSREELVLLLAVYLAVFSVLQRLGTDAVCRRTGSPSAAAVFGAILGAWFIAAVFPIV